MAILVTRLKANVEQRHGLGVSERDREHFKGKHLRGSIQGQTGSSWVMRYTGVRKQAPKPPSHQSSIPNIGGRQRQAHQPTGHVRGEAELELVLLQCEPRPRPLSAPLTILCQSPPMRRHKTCEANYCTAMD